MDGIEVSPSRALEAFWRWEHVCARSTRDILSDSGIVSVRSEAKMGKCKACRCRWLSCGCFAALAIANQLPVEL